MTDFDDASGQAPVHAQLPQGSSVRIGGPSRAPADPGIGGAGVKIEAATKHQWSSDSLRPDEWRGTIFEHARNKDGSPATEVTEDTIVKVPIGPHGMEMTAKQAYDHGFLEIDEDGKLWQVSPEERARRGAEREAERAETAQQELEKEMPRLASVDPEAIKAEDQLLFAATAAGRQVNQLVAEYLTRGELPVEVQTVAREAGISEPTAAIERVMEGYSAVAEHVMRANGVKDTADFVSWVQANIPRGEIVRAELRLFNGDPSGYRSFAERYRQNAPINHGAHGLKVTQGTSGDMVEFPDGRVMSARAARMAGLI
ncbi:MAG: hypothetical protein MI824_19110 [Hyphomicrobiales bacterium]|nr:hypothetical protein [Hyphomicrobiales bacterium]